jgi:general stress protein 26
MEEGPVPRLRGEATNDSGGTRPPHPAPAFDKLNRLYELIEDIEVAMLTTRRPDGSLVSRPMATQRRADGAHFWFVSAAESPKVREIALDPNVNLAYYKDRTREWVSVSGTALLSRDRAKIRELYEPSWKIWFGNRGGNEDGGPDDPRMVLIGVEARAAHFMTVEKSAPVLLFEYVRAKVTGEPAEMGEVQEITADDLA